jgi:signal transduction histidine kinase
MRKLITIIRLFFCPFLFYAQQAPLYINDGKALFPMANLTTFKEDKAGKDFNDIQKDTDFIPMTQDLFKLGGNHPRNIWVKFQMQKSITRDIYLELSTGITDSVFLYSVSPNNVVKTQRIGKYFDFNERIIKNNHQIFILYGNKDELCTYYLNIRSQFPLSIRTRIGTNLSFSEEYHVSDLLHGIFIGTVFIVALFNLLFFFSLKDNFYAFYVGYAFFIMCTVLRFDGYLFQFVYPNFPEFNTTGFYFHGLAGVFGIYFSRSFLKTKIYTPRLDKGLFFFLVFYIINVGFAALRLYELNILSVYFITFPFNIFLIYTGIQVYRKGYLVARFFVAGVFCLMIGITIFTLYNIGFLASNLWTRNIMYLGIAAESIMFFMAIIDRFSILRLEKHDVQMQMIESLQQNESLMKEKHKLLEENAQNRARQIETMQSQLSEYAQKLIKSNQELTDFAHIASHDLRAPIRNIGSFTQLLQKRLASQLDERTKEYFDFITTNVRQSTKLIEDLLNYSKIDKNIGDPTPIELNDVLILVKSNLQSFITEKKAHIIVKELPILRGHSSLIVQLFQNLINNGLKYNESQNPTVTISSEWRENNLVFSVSDNGIGILPQYREQVFGMFRRLHSSAQYEGSGIGLAFCQRIVSTYGGRIWIDSEAGKGTTFYFTLPDTVIKETESSDALSTLLSVQPALLGVTNLNDTEGGNQKGKNVFNGHARSKSYINPSITESEPALIQFDSRKTTNIGVISERHTASYSENATQSNSTDLEPLFGKTKEEHLFGNQLPPSS